MATGSAPSPPHLIVAGTSGADFNYGAAPGAAPLEHLSAGVVLPIEGAIQAGWARVMTPCQNFGWVRLADASTLSDVTVVLDPGHGGSELGAVGPDGLTEKALNLDVANRTAAVLASDGIDVVLTRTADYQATLAFRVAVAAAAHSTVFLSIHHNADPDGPSAGPGTETFYQYRSASSKRLAGLVYQNVTAALAAYHVAWVGNTDEGARWRLTGAGADYYGILRLADGDHLTASLAELMFISNPPEDALLEQPAVRQTEAQAVAQAIVEYLTTSDPGSGFSVPHPRTEPAGPGGGTAGCVDPITP